MKPYLITRLTLIHVFSMFYLYIKSVPLHFSELLAYFDVLQINTN